ncbi:MAG TPA: BON domain-containing protein [Alphaproteobacteria bacterium]|nr:BON domain-containing protein [Alphaproteobacteria bacterium]
MADQDWWDDNERRRRWEEDRYRRGEQYGRESQYGREGYREMTGYGGGYERERGYGPGRGGYDERRSMAGGVYSGDPYGSVYGGSGEYGGYGRRATDYREPQRGGYSQSYGGSGREYRGAGHDPRAPWPSAAEGHVGFGPSQGFWRTPEDYRSRSYGTDYQGYGRSGHHDPSRAHDWRGRGEDRGFFERAGDEIASWFGSEDAERRRQMDAQREGWHRGRGPRGYTRSDERIREDVSDRLTDDPGVDASEIDIQVSNGEVTLSGTVHSRWQKRRAEDIAEDVSGVKHVQNNLRVTEWTSGQSAYSSGERSSAGAGMATTAGTRDPSTGGTGVTGSASTSSRGRATTGSSD